MQEAGGSSPACHIEKRHLEKQTTDLEAGDSSLNDHTEKRYVLQCKRSAIRVLILWRYPSRNETDCVSVLKTRQTMRLNE